MAIRLEVKEYCADCCDFEPDVKKPEKTTLQVDDFTNPAAVDRYYAITQQSDTIVRCRYRNRCEAIKRYLEKQKEDKA